MTESLGGISSNPIGPTRLVSSDGNMINSAPLCSIAASTRQNSKPRAGYLDKLGQFCGESSLPSQKNTQQTQSLKIESSNRKGPASFRNYFFLVAFLSY